MYYLLELKQGRLLTRAAAQFLIGDDWVYNALDDYEDSAIDMLRCLLFNSMEGGDTLEDAHKMCGTNPKDRPNVWLYL